MDGGGYHSQRKWAGFMCHGLIAAIYHQKEKKKERRGREKKRSERVSATVVQCIAAREKILIFHKLKRDEGRTGRRNPRDNMNRSAHQTETPDPGRRDRQMRHTIDVLRPVNSEGSLFTYLFRPDITVMVDWALNINYLSTYLLLAYSPVNRSGSP